MRIPCTAAAFALTSALASADITAIGPFVGSLIDPLNAPGTTIVSSYDIFGGAGSLNSFDGKTTSIHYLLRDTFSGDLVTPRTGGHILGFTTGPATFVFDTPLVRFGAYFENNSGEDDALVEFFGAGGALIGTATADTDADLQDWTWNGWESDVGIASIRVTGNGIIDGFLWFDDLQGDPIPAPLSVGVFVAGAIGIARRKRG